MTHCCTFKAVLLSTKIWQPSLSPRNLLPPNTDFPLLHHNLLLHLLKDLALIPLLNTTEYILRLPRGMLHHEPLRLLPQNSTRLNPQESADSSRNESRRPSWCSEDLSADDDRVDTGATRIV